MFETALLTATPGKEAGINIGGYDFPCDSWKVRLYTSSIALPSVASGAYVDIIPGGHKQCVLRATGVWCSDFNIFSTAHAYLASYKTIILQIDEGEDPDEGTQLVMPSAFLQEWEPETSVDGIARFSLLAIGNYTFNDFGGLPA